MGWSGYPDLLPIVNSNTNNNNNSDSSHPLPWYPHRDLVCVSPLDRLRPVQYDTSVGDRSATLSPEPYMYHTTKPSSDMKELERFTGTQLLPFLQCPYLYSYLSLTVSISL